MWRSEPQMPTAVTRTSAPPAGVRGGGTDTIRSPPFPSSAAARIFLGIFSFLLGPDSAVRKGGDSSCSIG